MVAQVTDKFLAGGILEHGFARIRCDACAHEYLLAFSCKCRYFCPSCHAKRLAIWTQWLDATLFAPVPHWQVVLALTGERDLAVGIVACLQTHGSRVNWHPHLHLLVTV